MAGQGVAPRLHGSKRPVLCLTIEYVPDPMGSTGTFTYKTPTGATILTGRTIANTTFVDITCGGKTYNIDSDKPECRFGSGSNRMLCTQSSSCTCP